MRLFLFRKVGDVYDCVRVELLNIKESEAKNHSVRKFFAKVRSVLKCRRADGYVDTAVKMIIAVVVGALLLSGLYVLFNNTVLPGLAERIQDMFSL